jgi:membrane fusion protein, multidrug efflux system
MSRLIRASDGLRTATFVRVAVVPSATAGARQPRPIRNTSKVDPGSMQTFVLRVVLIGSILVLASSATAQTAASGPPTVGIVTVGTKSITETTELNGRVQALGHVDLSARVTGFLDERLFVEGAEVKKGDLLFRLERAPFEADVEAKRASVAQAQAQLENANLGQSRADTLLQHSAGTQSAADNARATQRTAAAQLRLAQAQLRQSEINLDYTEIRSPIDGRIGRASVTAGNVVSPSSGALATVVSQDPMYVTFPISVRRILDLYSQLDSEGGFSAVRIRLRLPDGRLYRPSGTLEFVDINVARDTDSIILRGTIPNPSLPGGRRELTHDELVRVVLESVKPREVLGVPRAAVLTDQQGDYVYVVGENNIAEQRRVKLGQSTTETATIIKGLTEGERVIAEGIQRVRPNTPVAPTPMATSVAEPRSAKGGTGRDL